MMIRLCQEFIFLWQSVVTVLHTRVSVMLKCIITCFHTDHVLEQQC